jgi:hypothetical protein
MILGQQVKCVQGQKSLELFQQMQQEGVHPNSVNFVGMLNACSGVVCPLRGQQGFFFFFWVQFCEVGGTAIIHKLGVLMSRLSKVDGIQMSLWGNRFVDMYAKCGSMECF